MSSIESESKETYSRALTCLLGLSPIYFVCILFGYLTVGQEFHNIFCWK